MTMHEFDQAAASDTTNAGRLPADAAVEQRRELTAPLGDATEGSLTISGGGAGITIAVDPRLTELIRAQFEGVLPRTAAEQGRVTIRYPRHSIVDWVKDVFLGGDRAARIALNGSIPWRLTVGDGASQLTADLDGLRLASFEVLGGVSQVSLTLPEPAGVVPLRIGGGASNLTIRRPAGVAVRLRVAGGASSLRFDEQYAGVIGGETRWATPQAADATNRYDVEVAGGASNLTIATI